MGKIDHVLPATNVNIGFTGFKYQKHILEKNSYESISHIMHSVWLLQPPAAVHMTHPYLAVLGAKLCRPYLREKWIKKTY